MWSQVMYGRWIQRLSLAHDGKETQMFDRFWGTKKNGRRTRTSGPGKKRKWLRKTKGLRKKKLRP
jgi:hypothetical protein